MGAVKSLTDKLPIEIWQLHSRAAPNAPMSDSQCGYLRSSGRLVLPADRSPCDWLVDLYTPCDWLLMPVNILPVIGYCDLWFIWLDIDTYVTCDWILDLRDLWLATGIPLRPPSHWLVQIDTTPHWLSQILVPQAVRSPSNRRKVTKRPTKIAYSSALSQWKSKKSKKLKDFC